jgi:hypothetical protein
MNENDMQGEMRFDALGQVTGRIQQEKAKP